MSETDRPRKSRFWIALFGVILLGIIAVFVFVLIVSQSPITVRAVDSVHNSDGSGKGQRTQRFFGLVAIYERHEPSGSFYRSEDSLLRKASYHDRNGDGRLDIITIRKAYIGYLRLPEPEFDQHFGDHWRDGLLVELKDNDLDGCFEKKRLAQRDDSGEVIVSDLIGDCDGNYQLVSRSQALKKCVLRAPTEEEFQAARRRLRHQPQDEPSTLPTE